MTKAIRYFRPDVLFAITPWHLAEVTSHRGVGTGYRAACGYKPPEGWWAEVKERGPRCVECEEMVENEEVINADV